MRISDIVKSLQDRQVMLERQVFKTDKFDAVDFAKAQGRWQGLGESINLIMEAMKQDED